MEELNSEKRITLYELNRLVQEVSECEMPKEYWVEAELSECRESHGHCFMSLVQYGDSRDIRPRMSANATPIAKADARCWASKWMLIRPYFERTTGQQLRAGMKVLLKVFAQFHEAYGFSWIVTDIDPTYTMGDMARKRQEIIRQLKEEGVFDLQKELHLPLFCQNIAIISSETAAGYGDFCKQLADNPYGFKFSTQLFPAIMQGEDVESSIISALENIYNLPFDCVVIIRGGGATSDMSGFDTLILAENVANFPIPIITGIGHDRDESILDMVSHTRVKTPTAAAAFLIDHLKGVLDTIEGVQNLITHYAQQKLSTLKTQLTTISELLPKLFSAVKIRQDARIDSFNNRLLSAVQQRVIIQMANIANTESRIPILLERKLTSERHLIELIEEKAKALDPTLLLQRGYSITLHQGKAVKDAKTLVPGDEMETRLAKGIIHSKVITN